MIPLYVLLGWKMRHVIFITSWMCLSCPGMFVSNFPLLVSFFFPSKHRVEISVLKESWEKHLYVNHFPVRKIIRRHPSFPLQPTYARKVLINLVFNLTGCELRNCTPILCFSDLRICLSLPFVKRKQSLLVHLPLNSRSIPCRRHSASSPCCSSVSCPLIVCLGTRRSLMQSQKFRFSYCEHPPAHVSIYLPATVVLTGKQH